MSRVDDGNGNINDELAQRDDAPAAPIMLLTLNQRKCRLNISQALKRCQASLIGNSPPRASPDNNIQRRFHPAPFYNGLDINSVFSLSLIEISIGEALHIVVLLLK